MADNFNINGVGNFNRLAANRAERIQKRQPSGDFTSALANLDKIEFSKNGSAENVSLSQMKERIRDGVLEELKDEGTVDSARIAELREQIAAGTYEIDVNELAKRMLFEVLE